MKLISTQDHEQRNVPRGELDFRQGVEVETGIPEHTASLRREGKHLWLH